jgi:hypothetical protein
VQRTAAHDRRASPRPAREIWYRHSGETSDALTDAILEDTCPRLVAPLERDAEKWRGMWRQFGDLGLSDVDEEGFEKL